MNGKSEVDVLGFADLGDFSDDILGLGDGKTVSWDNDDILSLGDHFDDLVWHDFGVSSFDFHLFSFLEVSV